MAASKQNGENLNGIVGQYFHTYDDEGQLRWQGEVLAKLNDCFYLVAISDWNEKLIVNIADMACESKSRRRWRFYGDEDEMHIAYKNYCAAWVQTNRLPSESAIRFALKQDSLPG
jgi:hypothetical protein